MCSCLLDSWSNIFFFDIHRYDTLCISVYFRIPLQFEHIERILRLGDSVKYYNIIEISRLIRLSRLDSLRKKIDNSKWNKEIFLQWWVNGIKLGKQVFHIILLVKYMPPLWLFHHFHPRYSFIRLIKAQYILCVYV